MTIEKNYFVTKQHPSGGQSKVIGKHDTLEDALASIDVEWQVFGKDDEMFNVGITHMHSDNDVVYAVWDERKRQAFLRDATE